jgi:hypothetical protein
VETVDDVFVKIAMEVYGETTPRGKKLLAQLQVEAKEKLKGKNVAYGDIISVTPIFHSIVELSPLRAYFAKTTLYQPFRMKKEIGNHGAVSFNDNSYLRNSC